MFGESSDAVIVRARIDLVAHLEVAHASTDPDDRPGHVVAQDQGQAVGKNQLEFAAPDLGIQRVDAGRVDLDQDIVVPQFGFGQVADAARFFLSVAIDDEGLHDGLFSSGFE